MNQIWESKPFMLLASVALLVNLNKILPNRSIDVPKRERIMGKTWLLVVVWEIRAKSNRGDQQFRVR